MHTVDDPLGNMERAIQKELNADQRPIAYPVRLSADGTGRLLDAAGRVLGSIQIRDALNVNHKHRRPG